MILVTGSDGLVGEALVSRLRLAGIACKGFDIRADPAQDVRCRAALDAAMEGVTGIVHLAAISRVVWGQNNPVLCEAVNVAALRELLSIAAASPARPWLVFVSSREIYGEVASLPVREDAPYGALNVYARSKVAGERLVIAAREAGLVANIVRLSNVYGTTDDHVDRVVPAFARVAALGGTLRIEGAENEFDFTHIDDVARGMMALVEVTRSGERVPPVHLLTGRGTTLGQLSQLASANARTPIDARAAPARQFDVARFYGDPSRAEALLGWRAEIGIEQGFARLVADFADCREAVPRPSFLPLLQPATGAAA